MNIPELSNLFTMPELQGLINEMFNKKIKKEMNTLLQIANENPLVPYVIGLILGLTIGFCVALAAVLKFREHITQK